MKPHSRSAMLATTLLITFFFNRPTTAATLPKEFTGVWIVAAENDNECKKQDWKNDRLINITAKAFEEFNTYSGLVGCTIKSVKTSRDSVPGARTSEVNLSCSGQGATWRSSEIWHVQNVSNRKIFTESSRQSDYRDEISGKKMGKLNPMPPRIFLECK